MKYSVLLLLATLLNLSINAQQANFNWIKDTLSAGNNLKGMTYNVESGSGVIIGYDNTFLKSEDDGLSWQNVSMFKPVYDFIGLAQGTDVVFISSRRTKVINHPSGGMPDVYMSGVLLKSTDMGATWEAMDINSAGFGDDALTNPNAEGGYAKDVFAVGALNKDTIIGYTGWYDQSTGTKVSRGAVYRTNNGGTTWWRLTPDLGNSVVSCVEVMDTTAAFGGLRNLYFTNLRTDSVTDIYPNLALGTDSNIYVNNITYISPKSFYVCTVADGIFKTADEGKTFTKLSGINGANDLIVINDSTILTLGNSSKSKLSTNNGETWINFYPGATCFKIGGLLNDTLYALSNEVAYKCALSDILSKNPAWTAVEMFEDERLQKMAIFNENKAVIAGYGNNCKYTTDGGSTWKKAQLPADYFEDIEFDFNSISSNTNSGYATVRRYRIADLSHIDSVNNYYMEGLLLKTADNWETQTLLNATTIGEKEGNDPTKNPQLDGCWGLNPFIVECVDANTAYLFANWYEEITTGTQKTAARVFKTNDGGASWAAITADFGSSYITSIKFSNDTGYIAGNRVLQKTEDGGATITDLYPNLVEANNGDERIYIQSIHMANNNEIYIPTTSDGVFYTIDGGLTFSKLDGIAGTSDIIKLDDNSFLCMGTTSKSKFTNDAGETWQNASAGIVAYSIGQILNDTLYVLGRGITLKIALTDLNLKTAIPAFYTKNELKVAYTPTSINLISTDGDIDQCSIYTINGKLLRYAAPNNSIFKLNNNEFNPGIYIVNTFVNGKRYVNKIAFR